MTLREVFVIFQGYMMETWDHTSNICLRLSWDSKIRLEDIHPFRQRGGKDNKQPIKRGNMDSLALFALNT